MLALLALLLSTVTNVNTSSSYACDGVQTVYSVGFPYGATSEIVVTSTTPANVATTLNIVTDYTLSLASTQSIATLTLTAGAKCPNLSTLRIGRVTPLTQPVNLRTQGPYRPETQEAMFDRLTRQMQETKQSLPILGKGQLFTGNAAGLAVLQPGTTGLVLTTDSSQPTGLSWLSAGAGASFTAPGTGGITRTIAGTLSDMTSVLGYAANGVSGAPVDPLGVTESSGGIQAAINYVQGLPSGGTVLFPCGTYLTNQVTITASKVALRGQDRRCVTLKANTASSTGLVNISSGGTLTNISIRDISFDANGLVTAGGMRTYQSGLAPLFPAVNFGVFNTGTDVNGFDFQFNNITGFDQGIYVPYNGGSLTRLHNGFILNNNFAGLSPTTQKDHAGIRINADTTLVQGNYLTGYTNSINPVNFAFSVKVIGNWVYQYGGGSPGGNDVGIYASKCTNCVIADNHYELYGGTGNVVSDGCIKLGAGTGGGTDFNNGRVHHNLCIGGHIKLSQGSDVEIDHNRIVGPVNAGCGQGICVTAENANPRAKIDANNINGPGGNCVQSLSTDATFITNNTCDAPTGGQCWDLRNGTNGWQIIGNKCRESLNHCVYADAVSNGMISTNDCQHSGTGATAGIRVGNGSTNVNVTMNRVAGYVRGFQVDTGANTGISFVGNEIIAGAASTYCMFADGSMQTSGMFGPNTCVGAFSTGNLVPANNGLTVWTNIPTTFATLGNSANGSFVYCSDCTIANPCAGAGPGAMAKRISGIWVCN